MRKSIVFVLGLLLGAALVVLLHPRSARAANSPTYISRFAGASINGMNTSTILFGEVKSISCVDENGKTVCYVLSQ
jgi:hypothetical protein